VIQRLQKRPMNYKKGAQNCTKNLQEGHHSSGVAMGGPTSATVRGSSDLQKFSFLGMWCEGGEGVSWSLSAAYWYLGTAEHRPRTPCAHPTSKPFLHHCK